jgi:Mn-dependent DtxR family transcriptional regulator
MKLPDGLTPARIRLLQEFRRLKKDALTTDEIRAVRHPVAGADGAAEELAARGYVLREPDGTYRLTEKAAEFLSYDPKPEDRR